MFVERFINGPHGRLNLATGPGDVHETPPLVMLHGVARRWQDFVAVAPVLAGRWRLHLSDFRGHGKSEPAAGWYRVVDYVRDAVAVVKQIGERPVVLYGHSLGALVAAATAAELGGAVRAVVMEDLPLGMLGSRIHETPFGPFFERLRDVVRRGGAVPEMSRRLADIPFDLPGSTQSVCLGELRDAATLRYQARCLSQMDPEVLDPLVEGRWMEDYDQEEVCRQIRCPALLLQADQSLGGMLSDEDARRAEAAMADCTRISLPGVGHDMRAGAGETLTRIVVAFLESL